MLKDAESQVSLGGGVVHVAPDPRGGWLVEAEDRGVVSSHATLEIARREAFAYATRRGFSVVVHDHRHPAAL